MSFLKNMLMNRKQPWCWASLRVLCTVWFPGVKWCDGYRKIQESSSLYWRDMCPAHTWTLRRCFLNSTPLLLMATAFCTQDYAADTVLCISITTHLAESKVKQLQVQVLRFTSETLLTKGRD